MINHEEKRREKAGIFGIYARNNHGLFRVIKDKKTHLLSFGIVN
jgi:hypothetical protein